MPPRSSLGYSPSSSRNAAGKDFLERKVNIQIVLRLPEITLSGLRPTMSTSVLA